MSSWLGQSTYPGFSFTVSSDRLAAYLTRRNNGIREAEMRLGVMLPAMLIGPAGLIVYGLTAQRDLHWIGYFAGIVMVDWAGKSCIGVGERYEANATQHTSISPLLSHIRWTATTPISRKCMFPPPFELCGQNCELIDIARLIAMNLGKQAISFGMGFQLLNWVLKDGYATIIAGVFTAVLLVNNMALIVFMVSGKRIRIVFSRSWLARMHGRTIKDPNQTH